MDAARDDSDVVSPDFEAFERLEAVERSRLERSVPERSLSDPPVLARSLPDLSLSDLSVLDLSVRELSVLGLSVRELSLPELSVRELSVLGLSAFEPSVLDPLRAPAFVWLMARRSFLAQPEPLKWTAGVESSFRIEPPHVAHASGAGPLTPWTTSTTRPQTVQA